MNLEVLVITPLFLKLWCRIPICTTPSLSKVENLG
nr:MAG TPA: hypothetical protein [Caudoviricetes sp.]